MKKKYEDRILISNTEKETTPPTTVEVKKQTDVAARSTRKKPLGEVQLMPKRPATSKDRIKPNENAIVVEYLRRIQKLPHVDLTDSRAVKRRINKYLDMAGLADMQATVEDAALALKCNRKEFIDIATGKARQFPKETIDAIKDLYNLITAQIASYMTGGKVPAEAGKFMMKNNFGYRDTQDVVVTAKLDAVDAQKLMDEAAMLPDIEDGDEIFYQNENADPVKLAETNDTDEND
ncbi:MAG: hypothetical protein LUD47_04120 [Clostridia bacterium]|nr:hypothetical protein [Clostridia bacterium]